MLLTFLLQFLSEGGLAASRSAKTGTLAANIYIHICIYIYTYMLYCMYTIIYVTILYIIIIIIVIIIIIIIIIICVIMNTSSPTHSFAQARPDWVPGRCHLAECIMYFEPSQPFTPSPPIKSFDFRGFDSS